MAQPTRPDADTYLVRIPRYRKQGAVYHRIRPHEPDKICRSNNQSRRLNNYEDVPLQAAQAQGHWYCQLCFGKNGFGLHIGLPPPPVPPSSKQAPPSVPPAISKPTPSSVPPPVVPVTPLLENAKIRAEDEIVCPNLWTPTNWLMVQQRLLEGDKTCVCVPGLGDCLFQSLSLALPVGDHHFLRQAIVDYIQFKAPNIGAGILQDLRAMHDTRSLSQYLDNLRKEHSWAGTEALEAVVQKFRCRIVVLTPYNENQEFVDKRAGALPPLRTVYVAYNGTNHYDAVVESLPGEEGTFMPLVEWKERAPEVDAMPYPSHLGAPPSAPPTPLSTSAPLRVSTEPAVSAVKQEDLSLFLAIDAKNVGRVRELLDKGCDVEKKFSGASPLEWACFRGSLEVVKLLLEKKADVRRGRPVQKACEGRRLEVVNFLLDQGLSLENRPDDPDKTALEIASETGYIELIELLLKKNADLRRGRPLERACNSGKLNAVKLLLERGAQVDGDGKETPLHIACAQGNTPLARVLLDRGADLHRLHHATGETPLHFACRSGSLELVKLLLQKGARTTQGDHNDATPFHVAVLGGNFDLVQELINHGVSALLNIDTRTPLGFTAEGKVLELRRRDTQSFVLGDSRPSVWREQRLRGYTPLVGAVASGDLRLVRLLEEKGALANNATRSDGITPLLMACFMGKLDIVRYLVGKGADLRKSTPDGINSLLAATHSGSVDVVRYLLDQDIPINGADSEGRTALAVACELGSLDIVGELLKRRAQVDVPDERGVTPFRRACQKGQLDVMAILRAHQASIERGNIGRARADYRGTSSLQQVSFRKGDVVQISDTFDNGWAAGKVNSATGYFPASFVCFPDEALPLNEAIESGNVDAVQFLLNNGASVEGTAEGEATPLSLACRRGQVRVVQLLLERGVPVDGLQYGVATQDYIGKPSEQILPLRRGDVLRILQKFENGWWSVQSSSQVGYVSASFVELLPPAIPLYEACREGQVETVRLLLSNGARVNVVAENGETPLIVASRKGHRNTVRLLLEAGADVERRSPAGQTALSVATEKGHAKIVKDLLLASRNPLGQNVQSALELAKRAGHPKVLRYLGDVQGLLRKHYPLTTAARRHAQPHSDQRQPSRRINVVSSAAVREAGLPPRQVAPVKPELSLLPSLPRPDHLGAPPALPAVAPRSDTAQDPTATLTIEEFLEFLDTGKLPETNE